MRRRDCARWVAAWRPKPVKEAWKRRLRPSVAAPAAEAAAIRMPIKPIAVDASVRDIGNCWRRAPGAAGRAEAICSGARCDQAGIVSSSSRSWTIQAPSSPRVTLAPTFTRPILGECAAMRAQARCGHGAVGGVRCGGVRWGEVGE